MSYRLTQEREAINCIRVFGQTHRLKTRLDDCSETIIPGKRGASHIYYYGNWPGESSPQTFAVMFMPDPKGERPPTTRQWNARKAQMLAAGFTVVQDCDGEGTARFDPTDKSQVELAIRVAGIRRRRVPSAAQLAVLEMARNRLKPSAQSLAWPRAALGTLEETERGLAVEVFRYDGCVLAMLPQAPAETQWRPPCERYCLTSM